MNGKCSVATKPIIWLMAVSGCLLVGCTQQNRPAASPQGTGDIIRQAITTLSQSVETDPRAGEAVEKLRSVELSALLAGLRPYLDSTTNTIRRSAIYALWKGGFADIKPLVPPLQKLLTHDEDLTRGMATLALGQNRVAASFDALTTMLKEDTSGYARRCAASALGLLGDPRAVSALKAALKDTDPLVSQNSQSALEMLKTTKP